MFDPVGDTPSSGPSSRPAPTRDAPARMSQEDRLAALATLPPGGLLASALEQILQAAIPRPDLSADRATPEPDGDLASTQALGDDERALLRHCQLAPGEPLAAVESLARLGLETLSELVAASQRLASWSCWLQSLLAAAMTHSVEDEPLSGDDAGLRPDRQSISCLDQGAELTVASEIACRLGISRRRAAQLIDRGQALCLPALSYAAGLHRSGLIDAAKTALIATRLAHVSHELAVRVQEQVLPRAPHRTHTQLARDLDRALVANDPEGSCQRRRRNAENRHVSRPQPAGEGLSEMRLLLPSLDAALVDATLDAIAVSARATGDERSVSQLRADAVVSTMLSLLRHEQHEVCRSAVSLRSALPEAPPSATPGALPDAPCGALAGATPSTLPGVPLTDLPDLSSLPGLPDLPGLPEDAVSRSAACEPSGSPLLADGVPLLPLLSRLSALVSSTSPWWTPSGSGPVLFPSGLQVQVDVTVPIDYLVQESFHTGLPRAGLPHAGAESGRHEQARPGWSAESPAAPSAHSPAGPSTAPPRLLSGDLTVRIGRQTLPVPSAIATALAGGGTWRRLLTDPVSGVVLDVGRKRYRPPAALAEAVRARDHTCTHPGCAVPARRCDLDHVTAWSMGGTTSFDNLTLLCQTHHRLKHTPGWSLTRLDDGALLWRTPSGARYRRNPDGSILMLPRRIGPRSFHQSARPVPDQLARAVDDAVLAPLVQTLENLAPGVPWQTRGPRPGQPVGTWSARSYSAELHALGLDVFLDELVPF
ncbi:MAG: DUF222 domain-containing protein [Actinomyces urogenitalis]|uniref:HNH endonuclease signature motif containing protein n=1 Tax=Actinomyces urogenitalis TaxID=103621 RepID=UPI002A832A16|nr:DUF222 domain-containing protein [Actinomyces urogenitalis]MDY3679058.1 DUF222 domain-containing protein [Actinomyces urogenitalis]